MCCLFGLIDHNCILTSRQKSRLISCLALESEARGTDAAGIAYNASGRLRISSARVPLLCFSFVLQRTPG